MLNLYKGYLRILQKLKWLNLSNLDNQPDIENYAAFISEVLPPDCQVIYSEGKCMSGHVTRLSLSKPFKLVSGPPHKHILFATFIKEFL